MFTEAPFTIARAWKQPRCPSTDEWIKKLWYIYTVEYYSAIKRNTFESVLVRWMNLELIMQSKVGQKKTYRQLTNMKRSSTSLIFKEMQINEISPHTGQNGPHQKVYKQ